MVRLRTSIQDELRLLRLAVSTYPRWNVDPGMLMWLISNSLQIEHPISRFLPRFGFAMWR